MVSERNAAKAAIQDSNSNDLDLSGTLGDAHQFKIELVKEENRHRESQTKSELGWFGRALGGEATAPIVIAALAALLGFIFAFVCLVLAAFDVKNGSFYSDWSTRAFAITTTAIGFIFGKKSK